VRIVRRFLALHETRWLRPAPESKKNLAPDAGLLLGLRPPKKLFSSNGDAFRRGARGGYILHDEKLKPSVACDFFLISFLGSGEAGKARLLHLLRKSLLNF
jgi:hypothetical protein